MSRWNHTKIFSDFDDEEMENSDAEYVDAGSISGQKKKDSSKFEFKASLRSVYIMFITYQLYAYSS